MTTPAHIRFGDPAAPPRLALGWSAWASMNIEGGFTTKLTEARERGFETIEMSLDPMFADFTASLRENYGFDIVGQGQSLDAEGAKPIVEAAVHHGVVALNLHIGHGFMSAAESVDIIGQVVALADAAGVLVMFETHRGRSTQDPLRTTEIIALRPDIGLNLDVSHWILSSEGEGNAPEAWLRVLDTVFAHTVMVHGRVSDGQTIQSDIGEDGSAAVGAPFVAIWTDAMRAWVRHATPGDVFVFTPELGPAPYSSIGPEGAELVDRWSRSLAMADLGRRAWAAANAAD